MGRDAPADRIRVWLEEHMINDGGVIGWINPTGTDDAVKDLLDRILPGWQHDVPKYDGD